MTDLTSAIDDLLPQTQCGKCGHQGCLPYARAVANGEPHNRCPPGGQQTADALAGLLGRPSLPLDDRGYPEATVKKVAYIREDECIGCTKCIQACPVDAIVGAAHLMHTVITDECTGCDLCVEPCPVDCIDMLPVAEPSTSRPATAAQPDTTTARAMAQHARDRFQARQDRLRQEKLEKEQRRQERRATHRKQQDHARVTEPPSASRSPQTPQAFAGHTSAGENQRHVELLRLKSAYKTAHKQYKQASAALERMQRQGESATLDATRTRVAALKARADHCRQQVDQLMSTAKADIARLTGKDLKTLKLEAAHAEIALVNQQRAVAAHRNADAAMLAQLHQQLEACKQTALAARQALVQALHQQGLYD